MDTVLIDSGHMGYIEYAKQRFLKKYDELLGSLPLDEITEAEFAAAFTGLGAGITAAWMETEEAHELVLRQLIKTEENDVCMCLDCLSALILHFIAEVMARE